MAFDGDADAGANDDDDDDDDNEYSSDETDIDNDYWPTTKRYLDYIHKSLRKIEANDPTFTMLTFGLPAGNRLPPDNVWENLGNAIGRNTQLKEISFYPREYLFHRFLPGFVLNRSIQKIRIFTMKNN
jgi:hypothetical protein